MKISWGLVTNLFQLTADLFLVARDYGNSRLVSYSLSQRKYLPPAIFPHVKEKMELGRSKKCL